MIVDNVDIAVFFQVKVGGLLALYEPIRSQETNLAEVERQSFNSLPREPWCQNVCL